MINHNLMYGALPIQLTTLTAGAAGTSEIDTAGVDMQNAQAVAFFIPFGTITSGAATSVKVQGSADNSTNWTDLAGTAITILDTNDDKTAIIDIYRPIGYRYLRAVVLRATQNAVVGTILAVVYHVDNNAPAVDTSIISAKVLSNITNGTA